MRAIQPMVAFGRQYPAKAPVKRPLAQPLFGQDKTYRVEVWTHGAGTPIVHDQVTTPYIKAAAGVGFYCVREQSAPKTTLKYPMNNIFRVKETENDA